MDPQRDDRDMRPQLVDDLKPSSGGIELAMAGGLAVAIGYWLDGQFGIRPVLTIVLFLWAVIALSISFYYRYRADMEIHEAAQPWAKNATAPTTTACSDRATTEPEGAP